MSQVEIDDVIEGCRSFKDLSKLKVTFGNPC